MTTTIQLVDGIAALDRDKQIFDQTTITEIQKQRDLYKTALDRFVDGLKHLQTKKALLLERLVVKIDAPFQLKENVNQVPSNASPVVAPTSTSDLMTEIQTVSEIDTQDQKIQELTQETIDKCTRQRDLYRDALCRLNIEVEKAEEEIRRLEAQLAENDVLAAHISKVQVCFISDEERNEVLQNLIFLFYQTKKKTQNLITPSVDDKDLQEAAQEAFNKIQEKLPEKYRKNATTIDLKSIVESYKRNVSHKETIFKNSIKNFSRVEQEIESALEEAKKICGQFYLRKSEYTKQKLLEKKNRTQSPQEDKFSDFPFKGIGLLAGQLSFLRQTLTAYKDKLNKNHPKFPGIEKKIREIEEIQTNFSNLLLKCRVKLPKYLS
jgi:hypothetical protein